MKRLCYILFCFNVFGLFAQNQINDENIKTLIEKYSPNLDLKCNIIVKIEVEGMNIPNQQVYVEFRKNKKTIVKGKGLALLPKKGFVNQFNELFSTPLHAIFLSRKKNNLIYKLVSLDQKSDWITADIIFDEQSFLIYEATLNTRKNGTFHIIHSYSNNIYPSKSIITFSIKEFKITLKFIGRKQNVINQQKTDKDVNGKITLLYTYL